MNDTFTTEEKLRKMPFSMEAEQSVLGTLILNPQSMNDVASVLKSEDFYLESHAYLYEAMRDIFMRPEGNLDAVTLLDEITKSGRYDKAGGKTYITTLASSVPVIENLPDYVRIIKEKATLRRLIAASSTISEMAYTAEGETKYILDRSEQLIFEIAEKDETKGFVKIRDVIHDEMNRLGELQKLGGEATVGIPTYFSAIDNYLIGMGEGDLIIVGARPGVGKTSFVLNIATNVALRTKKTVAIFSLEMSSTQLVSRVLASEALIDSYKMRKGTLDPEDWQKLARAAGTLYETEILIDDTPGISVMGMKSKLRRVENLGLVVVDYLQLMQADKKTDNRVNEVSDISRNLKLLAKELGVPVIACAQLSRATEKDGKKNESRQPMLSDLRDSGAIEQDADTIMFLSRDYYKNKPDQENLADCIIAKNRKGSTGTVTLGWYGQFTKFITIDKQHEE